MNLENDYEVFPWKHSGNMSPLGIVLLHKSVRSSNMDNGAIRSVLQTFASDKSDRSDLIFGNWRVEIYNAVSGQIKIQTLLKGAGETVTILSGE